MTPEYIKRLLELVSNLKEYRETTDCKDLTFLSKVDYLIGYIESLKL